MAKAPSPTASAKAAVKKAAPKAKAAAKKTVRAVRPVKLKAEATTETFKDQATAFVGKAGEKAREYASTGKDKATDSLFSISDFVDDVAKSVDTRLGKQYGDYARRAASAVSGLIHHRPLPDTLQLLRASLLTEKPRCTETNTSWRSPYQPRCTPRLTTEYGCAGDQ